MDFATQYAAAIFGIVGVLLGAVLSFAMQWRLSKRDYDLRVWDKLLDRRVSAHEAIIGIALQMRVTMALGGFDDDGELMRIPAVMRSKEDLDDWVTVAITKANAASPWLTVGTTREVYHLQDYVTTLVQTTASTSPDAFRQLAQLVRTDLIDISESLERAAYAFFERDIRRLKLRDLGEGHKHPREVTERRLAQTRLFSDWERIASLSAADTDSGGA